jgi:hypothetical protein
VVLVVRASVCGGGGWGVVVFSMLRGFGVQRVLGTVEYFVLATCSRHVIVGCVVVLVGV